METNGETPGEPGTWTESIIEEVLVWWKLPAPLQQLLSYFNSFVPIVILISNFSISWCQSYPGFFSRFGWNGRLFLRRGDEKHIGSRKMWRLLLPHLFLSYYHSSTLYNMSRHFGVFIVSKCQSPDFESSISPLFVALLWISHKITPNSFTLFHSMSPPLHTNSFMTHSHCEVINRFLLGSLQDKSTQYNFLTLFWNFAHPKVSTTPCHCHSRALSLLKSSKTHPTS